MKAHKGVLLNAAVVCVLAAAGFGTVAGVAGGAGLGSATFTDPAGDVQGAPDITAIAISDDASGLIQVSVTATGLLVNTAFMVSMNTDANASTGLDGADYVVGIDRDADGLWWEILRWDGAKLVTVPESPTMGYTRSGDTYNVRFARADIGSPSSLEFLTAAVAFDANGDIVAGDRAPDGGTWIYQLSKPVTTTTVTTSLTPLIGKAKTAPAVVRAGQRVTVTFPLTRKEDGSKLTGGTMMCDPKVGTKVLAHSESIGPGLARLSFVVPKTAKGKTLKVNLTIRLGGKTAHTVASFLVK